VFSPEFVTCKICGETVRGRVEKCQSCGSEALEGIARITQYFSRISGWNKGKLAELRDRKRYNIINAAD
jgi:ribonucleoside-triphosphate reductase